MQGSDDDRQAIANRLQALSLPEFVDVLRRVLPARGNDEGRNGLTHRLVLAAATIFGEEVPLTADDRPVVLEVVAWPDRDYYDGGFGPQPDLFEQGACARCGVEVISTAKHAFCAICGELCYLT
jgi:hypothetical protein